MRLLVLACAAMIMPIAAAYDLSQHQWQERLLILIAPSLDDPSLQQQRCRISERRDAVDDRDLRVIELGKRRGLLDGKPLGAAQVASLRAIFASKQADRLLILIGLDGGEKRRVPLDTNLTELFQQIDGMPMRRADIRAKQAAGIPVSEP